MSTKVEPSSYVAPPPRGSRWWKRLRGFTSGSRAENLFVRAVNDAIPALHRLPKGSFERDFAEAVVIPQLHLLESMVVWGEPVRFRPEHLIEVHAILDVIHAASQVYMGHDCQEAALALLDVESRLRSIRRRRSYQEPT